MRGRARGPAGDIGGGAGCGRRASGPRACAIASSLLARGRMQSWVGGGMKQWRCGWRGGVLVRGVEVKKVKRA